MKSFARGVSIALAVTVLIGTLPVIGLYQRNHRRDLVVRLATHLYGGLSKSSAVELQKSGRHKSVVRPAVWTELQAAEVKLGRVRGFKILTAEAELFGTPAWVEVEVDRESGPALDWLTINEDEGQSFTYATIGLPMQERTRGTQ